MLRNLDVLTNEEGVLQKLQEIVPPALTAKISKILICRDPLTSTSRGICYLNFDNLVDSMNTHNALKALATPLRIDGREVIISYCVDSENRTIDKKALAAQTAAMATMSGSGPGGYDATPGAIGPRPAGQVDAAGVHQYQMADVKRLAEYSASCYASNPAEHEQYVQFYSNYYAEQIAKGQMSNFPTIGQIDQSANSGAAAAQSAMQWKKQKGKHDPPIPVATPTAPVRVPNGKGTWNYGKLNFPCLTPRVFAHLMEKMNFFPCS
jgi:RNA-binding protein 5/10